jgi:hypothetical protein
MTTALNYSGTICAGGEHAHVTVTLPGGATRTYQFLVSDVRKPLAQFSEEELATGALLVGKLHFAGMTANQVRNALEAVGGVDLVI